MPDDDLIVLAMHGAPPRDFPERELGEFMALHARVEHSESATIPPAMRLRAEELERRVRSWPRNAENDPFWAASLELGRQLERATGRRVLVGFNEFCAPDLPDVFEAAVAASARRVVVVTPMLTQGGGHAELDIPAAMARAQAAHPEVAFVYAWPYDLTSVAAFLARHLEQTIATVDAGTT